MSMKTTIGQMLKIPLVLLVIIAFAASIYLAYNNLYDITYRSTFVLGIILITYFIGIYLTKADEFVDDVPNENEEIPEGYELQGAQTENN